MSENVSVECVGRTMRVTVSGAPGRFFAVDHRNRFTNSWQRLSPPGMIGPAGSSVLTVDLSRFANETVTFSVVSSSDSSLGRQVLRSNSFQFQVSLFNLRPLRAGWY